MGSQRAMRAMSQDKLIRASDVAQYVFCQRAWWLARVWDVPSTNVGEMQAGAVAHQRHGWRVIWAARARQAGVILLAVAFLLLLIYVLTLVRGS